MDGKNVQRQKKKSKIRSAKEMYPEGEGKDPKILY